MVDLAIGRDGTREPPPDPLLPDPLAGLVTGERYEPDPWVGARVRLTVPGALPPAPDVRIAVAAELVEPPVRRPAPRPKPRPAPAMPAGLLPPRKRRSPGEHPPAAPRVVAADRTQGATLATVAVVALAVTILVVLVYLVRSVVDAIQGVLG